jgi:hypothetical protein
MAPPSYSRNATLGPPIVCTRYSCTAGSIQRATLQRLLDKGSRPTCRECAKRGVTSYFRMPPGGERLSFAELQLQKERQQKLQQEQGRPKPDGPQWNTMAPSAYKKLQQQFDSVRKELDVLKKAKGAGGNGVEGSAPDILDPQKGLTEAQKSQLKVLGKKRNALLAYTDEQIETSFDGQDAYQKRLDHIQATRDAILADNRSKLPVKEQHTKCSKFVDKLVMELRAVKEEQNDLLAKWNLLDEQVKARDQALASKREELSDLSKQLAQEEAIVPAMDIDCHAGNGGNKSILENVEKDYFKQLSNTLTYSNVQELLGKQGATPMDSQAFASMWNKVGKALLGVDGEVAQTPPAPKPTVLSTQQGAASAAGPSSVAAQPSEAEVAEATQKWTRHCDGNPDLAQMGLEELAKAKSALMGIKDANDRSTPY